MRVSDADRSAATDRLSRHYGEGRLDEAEFNDRLDRAMRAITQSDLDGLFTDLPGDQPEDASQPGTGPAADLPAASQAQAVQRDDQSGHSARRLVSLALLVVAAIAISRSLSHLYIPWLLIGLLGFLVLRYGGSRRR